ncbi:MAG: hypothetical protein HZA19_05555, partial [Nitrospirae bacterium]|nr:hypothetical protein [Nitrospirota bacterium]
MTNPPPILHWRTPLRIMVVCLGICTMLLYFSKNVRAQNAEETHHDAAAELGHKLHPVHTGFPSKISGWLVAIAQGTSGSKDSSGQENDRAEGSQSMNLFFETNVKDSGTFLVHLDVQQGEGLTHVPPLFVSPNGNTTGTNNDIESFVNDQVHLDEAWYETALGEGQWTLTFGQLDPTAYFDTNNYANNQRYQFLANEFGNNPTIEFGGTGNFYGAGFRLTYAPTEQLAVTAGALDGDGDYAEMFDKPFIIGEVDLTVSPGGKEGTYRVYVWQNSLTHYSNFLTVVGGTELDPDTGLPVDSTITVIGDKNTGFGISLDQVLTD